MTTMATWCAVAGRRVAELRAEDFALPSAELTETLRGVTKELFDCGAPRGAARPRAPRSRAPRGAR